MSVLLAILALVVDGVSVPKAPQAAHYRTATCDVLALGPGQETSNIVRDYLVTPSRHSTRYRFFADSDCRRPLFTFQLSGRIVDRGPSRVVAGEAGGHDRYT